MLQKGYVKICEHIIPVLALSKKNGKKFKMLKELLQIEIIILLTAG